MKKVVYCMLLSLLLGACSSWNYVSIETREPAILPLPADVRNIVFIDNSLVGQRDSSNIILLNALSQFIRENQYFDNVDVLAETEGRINGERLKSIRDSLDADAFVLLNSFVMSATKTKSGNHQIHVDSLIAYLQVNMSLFGADGQILSTTPLSMSDSLLWVEVRSGDDYYLTEPLPSGEELLKEITIYTATQLEKYFVPYWNKRDRQYYTDGTTQMKQASAFARGSNWENALEVWQSLYNENKNVKKKARLALNISLAHEMLDNLEDALAWIAKAEKDYSGVEVDVEESDYVEAYKEELQNRIEAFKVLDSREE
ncbi:DUF6340 family protein [Dysgonomonas sp. 520]|uniref:DUF6340 family protein n=1 Tax=Dysgonomonas sp. 520 TaxID=2302931 RepID=UPI0013D352B6|nr:DUF6340 family protein [Dysgonomonas sp. 520]NDW08524.1 hypothetical protein [Dysgonomonas sp. 520]